MDIQKTVTAVLELFPDIFLHYYRRRDPRAWRPTPETLAVLEHLAATGPLTITEAARHFDRSQSATSELCDRMITRGLLDRIQDERDRRRHLIWLTPLGRETLAEERQVLCPDRLNTALDRLDAKQRDQLVQSLQTLLTAAKPTKPGK